MAPVWDGYGGDTFIVYLIRATQCKLNNVTSCRLMKSFSLVYEEIVEEEVTLNTIAACFVNSFICFKDSDQQKAVGSYHNIVNNTHVVDFHAAFYSWHTFDFCVKKCVVIKSTCFLLVYVHISGNTPVLQDCELFGCSMRGLSSQVSFIPSTHTLTRAQSFPFYCMLSQKFSLRKKVIVFNSKVFVLSYLIVNLCY